MLRRTIYRVAGESLAVEVCDLWAAETIDAFFERWYLLPETATGPSSAPAIVMRSEGRPARVPPGLPHFAIAGAGTCYTDGAVSYIDIDGAVVTIAAADSSVDVSLPGPLPLDSPSLARIVTYALAAALRKRRRFEMHSAAVVDPGSGRGVLIIGASGSGKSTLAVNLASAGWRFLTDDVVLLGHESRQVTAWPLRRYFAVTSQTVASCRVLHSGGFSERMDIDMDGKRHFLPHEIFSTAFEDRCVPTTLLFAQLADAERSRLARLSTAETMARLMRMNPWCCYDRSTAGEHLAVLSALAKQGAGFVLLGGRDLLDAHAAATLMAACVREQAA